MRLGHIYKITNKVNGKIYIGQTARDIEVRFAEHINTEDDYPLHRAIKKYGWQNFVCEEIESVPLEKLDEREIYWIEFYHSNSSGYNATIGGKSAGCYTYGRVRVKENGIVFASKEDAARWFNKLTSWSTRFLSDKIAESLFQNKDFLSYHFEIIPSDEDINLTSDDRIIDWIKTLNIRYQGKHIYCPQLDLDFDTSGEAARYMIENGLYNGNSKMPIQSLVTSIGKLLRGKIDYIESTRGNLTFEVIPGPGIKNKTSEQSFKNKKVYCSQIDKVFESQTEAAEYFIDNKIWENIKIKTARLRISDVVRGVFPDYRGYTFKRVE